MSAKYFHHSLRFHRPAQTSRDTLREKDCWFVWEDMGTFKAVGECGPIWGLSPASPSTYEHTLDTALKAPIAFIENRDSWKHFPSIAFGLETFLLSRQSTYGFDLIESPFASGEDIPINGLVWMGELDFMQRQISEKLEAGYQCLKLKIGALDWESEYSLLKGLRKAFATDELEIRVDANGAFSGRKPAEKLKQLADLAIHSIEQPIQPGNWQEMAALCTDNPIPIALDEELIGISEIDKRLELLDVIRPQYLILKPSLLGGFASCDEWIALAEQLNIGWWATSMLESNVGLNAIAQWVSTKHNPMPQGLGTGELFENNIPSPLSISRAQLHHSQNGAWDIDFLPSE